MRKKLLAMLLAVVMAVGLLPGMAWAADETSGKCGANVTWSYSDGVLTIEGSGPMDDYLPADYLESGHYGSLGELKARPWDWPAYREMNIHTVVIGSGVTSIGSGAFLNVSVATVIIPTSVKSIGVMAFTHIMEFATLEDVYYAGTAEQWKQIDNHSSSDELRYAKYHYESTGPGIEEPEPTTSGTCGENLTWTLSDGVLTISGTGAMSDYDIYDNLVPWYHDFANIHTIIIENGVTSIGTMVFWGRENLSSVTIPNSVTSIGRSAFYGYDNGPADVYYGGTADQWTKISVDPFNDSLLSANIHYNSTGPEIEEPSEPEIPFTDVKPTSYYAGAVSWAAENGITNGTVDGTTFSPSEYCPNIEILTFLYRADRGEVSEDDMDEAVNWARAKGMIGDTFVANDDCTRADVVMFIWQASGATPPATDSSFTDVPDDADYADAVSWAVEKGVTIGVGGGLFDPNGFCTRAQIVTFLYRAYVQSL